jgi:Fic family protein
MSGGLEGGQYNSMKHMDTHSWINFSINLKSTPYHVWILLGAAESKCRHLSGIPLRPEKQQELNRVSLRKGAQATTAIEGNSLSEEEIERIIDNKDDFPRSKEYQCREVFNVIGAYNAIAGEVNATGTCKADYSELKRDNQAILAGLQLENDVIPGNIRNHSVVVGKYRGAPAEECDYLLNKLFEWLNEDWGMDRDHKMIEGILKAITAHLYIAWIHPFGDGNGRSARMLEFRLLMTAGVPLNAAHLLTTHYNNTRPEYYNTLAVTSRGEGEPSAFILYSLQGFVDSLDSQIKAILSEQLKVTWENYVHYHEFSGILSSSDVRRRDLLLELSDFGKPISPDELKKRLSDSLILKYANMTPRAYARDINALCARDLIIKTEKGILAARSRMRAFLPICRQ